jgi:UDP-glucose 4-epimerase
VRVLVTGGAGFIGSHIVGELLARGDEVVVLDDLSSGSRDNLPDNVPFHHVDIRDRAGVARVFDEVRPELVSHQAAQMSVSLSVREPVFDAEVNGLGFLHVLENCVRCGVQRVTFASSGGVLYGEVAEPASEESPVGPISPYGITKLLGEQYLQFFARETDLEAVALRYTNVYGPRQNPHGEAGVVAIFAKAMLEGRQATIFGQGDCIRDYVYVDDVARANVASLFSDFSDQFTAMNIGTAIGTDVNQIATGVHAAIQRELAGKNGEIGSPPMPKHGPSRAGDLKCNLASSAKAKRLINWEPSVALDDGLNRTVAWFASRRQVAADSPVDSPAQ